jgi:hypothetical protein
MPNMEGKYELCLSARPRGAIRLIFRLGEYDALPREAKIGGPWALASTGEIVKLRPEIRLALARDGYCRIVGKPVDYRVEA